MEKTKKIVKILGNILSVVAVVFIVSRFLKFELDYRSIMNTKTLGWFGLALLMQIVMILVACFPWMKFVEIFSEKKMNFQEVQQIFVKSNLFKYIPGNVFQYVARNELAIVTDTTHLEVATATLIDTVLSLGVAFLISLLMVREKIVQFLVDNYNRKLLIIIIVVVVLVVVVCIGLLAFKRTQIEKAFSKMKKIVSVKNLKPFASVLIFYLFNNVLNCVIFLSILIGGLSYQIEVNQTLVLLGGFLFSMIAGIITPGASGGIGIRESVMMIISANMFELDYIVLSMVILRIISIVADIVAWLLCQGRKLIKENVK